MKKERFIPACYTRQWRDGKLVSTQVPTFPSSTWYRLGSGCSIVFQKIPLNYREYSPYLVGVALRNDYEKFYGRVKLINKSEKAMNVDFRTLPLLASASDFNVIPPYDERVWNITRNTDDSFVVEYLSDRFKALPGAPEFSILNETEKVLRKEWSSKGLMPVPKYKANNCPAIHACNVPRTGKKTVEYFQNGTFTGMVEIKRINPNGSATCSIFPDDHYKEHLSPFTVALSNKEINKVLSRSVIEEGFSLNKFEFTFIKRGYGIRLVVL